MTHPGHTVRTRLICLTAATLVLVGAGQALAADKHIDVTVRDAGGSYKLQFEGSLCPGNPDPGCIMVEYGNSPMISWEITDRSNMDWRFTALQFSPDGVNWGTQPLTDCTVTDFALSESDRQSGNASTAQIVANGKRIQIHDRNRNECVTHYKLTARSIQGDEIDSDPIIDNRGGN